MYRLSFAFLPASVVSGALDGWTDKVSTCFPHDIEAALGDRTDDGANGAQRREKIPTLSPLRSWTCDVLKIVRLFIPHPLKSLTYVINTPLWDLLPIPLRTRTSYMDGYYFLSPFPLMCGIRRGRCRGHETGAAAAAGARTVVRARVRKLQMVGEIPLPKTINFAEKRFVCLRQADNLLLL